MYIPVDSTLFCSVNQLSNILLKTYDKHLELGAQHTAQQVPAYPLLYGGSALMPQTLVLSELMHHLKWKQLVSLGVCMPYEQQLQRLYQTAPEAQVLGFDCGARIQTCWTVR